MRVKIISDSTCDLKPELLERYDIAITPLCIIKDGEELYDCVNITPAAPRSERHMRCTPAERATSAWVKPL